MLIGMNKSSPSQEKMEIFPHHDAGWFAGFRNQSGLMGKPETVRDWTVYLSREADDFGNPAMGIALNARPAKALGIMRISLPHGVY